MVFQVPVIVEFNNFKNYLKTKKKQGRHNDHGSQGPNYRIFLCRFNVVDGLVVNRKPTKMSIL